LWTELEAWQRLSNVQLDTYELDLIVRLDAVFCEKMQVKKE
jgi:hypothetical protein